MKSAYYSRANSYSKSFNATQAENEGRFPRSRAAKELGLSLKAFDAGCAYVGYNSNEWHHVGKYANQVDYYDTVELGDNPRFWKGATTKANKAYCKAKISETLRDNLKLKFKTTVTPQVSFRPSYSEEDAYNITSATSDHNLFKVIREVSRLRAEHRAAQAKYQATHLFSRKRKFWLNIDGAIITNNNGKQLQYSDVDWGSFVPDFASDKGVHFIHINYYN